MPTIADVIKKYGSMENFKAQTAQPAQMPVQNVAVEQTTIQPPVQATLPQQTTVAPSVSTQSNPNKEGTLAYNIWEKNNTAKTATPVAPVQPVAAQAPVDNSVVFGEQAAAKQATDTQYLDKRNEQIAQQTVDQLNSIATQGQKVDATMRDSIMEGLIAKAGGQVQWDSRDRQNTIDQINTKVLQQTGAKDWNTAFSTINKPYSQITQYTNGESLGKALDNGLVSASQLENIKKFNPTVYEEYQNKKANDANLALVNMSKPTTSALVADKGIDIGQLFQSLGLDITKSADIDLVAKRQDLYNTGEVKTSQDTYLKDKKELETLQDTYNNIEDDVRAEYEGTGVTESFIMAKVANRQKPIYKQMQTQERNYGNSLLAMQLAMGNAKDELDIYAQQATLDRQETMDKLQMGQFAYDIMADQQAREDEFKLADIQFQQEKDMLAYKYDMEYGDINSSDPRIQQRYFDRISEDFVKQYEGLVKSTPQQLSARIKADVQSGKTIGQAMNTIMEDLKKNDNYGAYIKKKAGVDDTPFSVGGRVYKRDANGDVIQIGNDLMYDIYGGINGNGTTQTDSSIPGNIENPNFRNKSVTPAVRNNNPGNITDLGFGGQKVEGERFTVFETPQQGFQALVSKIQNIQNGGSKTYSAGMTLTQFFGKYAPSSDNNNPDQYAISVASRLGVSANTTVGQVDPVKLAWEISRHEDVNMYNLLKSGVASAGGSGTGTAPSAIELMWFTKGTIAQKAGQDGISRQRFNEIDSYMKANKGTSLTLDDDQRTLYLNMLGKFQSNQVIVQFENAMTQYGSIKASLDNPSGPGDVAGIFGFMKSLDPTSVVRESEFNTAAASAGVVGKIGNAYQKLIDGKQLTDAQREAFTGLAKKYVEVRAMSYDRMYNDMTRAFGLSNIPQEYRPSRASEQVLGTTKEDSKPTNVFNNAFTSTSYVSDVYGVNDYIRALYGQ